MKKFRLVLIAGVILLLFGCATGAQWENMVYHGPKTKNKTYPRALMREVKVKTVAGGKKTNPLWVPRIGNEDFLSALEKSLAEQGLLNQSGRYLLETNILEVTLPFDFDRTVRTRVQYVLKDTKDNSMLLGKIIEGEYIAKLSDSFYGPERYRLATEGSVRKNIERLLNTLSSLNL